MTNEQKLKDLMTRMVTMSPEPPEFPEEMTMTQTAASPRRSPALIFAVAAAAVLALALPFYWLRGNAEPAGTTTASTPTTPVPVTVEGVVFMSQTPENSLTGNPALVPFEMSVTDDTGLLVEGADILDALAHLEQLGLTLPEGFESVIPDGVELDAGASRSGVTEISVNQAFVDGAGGLLADMTMLNQVVYTATSTDPTGTVLFTLDGEPIEAYGTEGLSLTDPIGRDDFIEELNPILVTEPVGLDDQGRFRLVGRANVFEATLVYRVLPDGPQGFTTATSGTGTWGDFEILIDPVAMPEGGVIEVYTESGEDGSPIFLIRIPFAHDGGFFIG